MVSARQQGSQAFLARDTTNPHAPGSPAAIEWQSGYDAARKQWELSKAGGRQGGRPAHRKVA